MPTLLGTANKDVSSDSSGSLKVVASLSSKSQTDSPAVVTFVRPLQLPATYKGKGEYYQLKKAINQVRCGTSPLHQPRSLVHRRRSCSTLRSDTVRTASHLRVRHEEPRQLRPGCDDYAAPTGRDGCDVSSPFFPPRLADTLKRTAFLQLRRFVGDILDLFGGY